MREGKKKFFQLKSGFAALLTAVFVVSTMTVPSFASEEQNIIDDENISGIPVESLNNETAEESEQTADKKVTDIQIFPPYRCDYIIGHASSVDYTDMMVMINYSDGTTESVYNGGTMTETGLEITYDDNSIDWTRQETRDETITVTIDDVTESFVIHLFTGEIYDIDMGESLSITSDKSIVAFRFIPDKTAVYSFSLSPDGNSMMPAVGSYDASWRGISGDSGIKDNTNIETFELTAGAVYYLCAHLDSPSSFTASLTDNLSITSARLIQPPAKNTYMATVQNAINFFDFYGMQIEVTFSDGSKEIVYNNDSLPDGRGAGISYSTGFTEPGSFECWKTFDHIQVPIPLKLVSPQEYIKDLESLTASQTKIVSLDHNDSIFEYTFTPATGGTYLFSSLTQESFFNGYSMLTESDGTLLKDTSNSSSIEMQLEADKTYIYTTEFYNGETGTINVTPVEDITDVTIISTPSVTEYPVGYINANYYDGLRVKITYRNGQTEEIEYYESLSDGRRLSFDNNIDINNLGNYRITVSFNNGLISDSTEIKIITKEEFIKKFPSLPVDNRTLLQLSAGSSTYSFTAPDTGNYTFSLEQLSGDGNVSPGYFTITTYLNSYIGDYFLSTEDPQYIQVFLEAGESYLCTFYCTGEGSFYYTAHKSKEVSSLELITLPIVTQYLVVPQDSWLSLNTEGLKVKVIYTDDTAATLSANDISAEGQKLTCTLETDGHIPGEYPVTISLGNANTSYNIQILSLEEYLNTFESLTLDARKQLTFTNTQQNFTFKYTPDVSGEYTLVGVNQNGVGKGTIKVSSVGSTSSSTTSALNSVLIVDKELTAGTTYLFSFSCPPGESMTYTLSKALEIENIEILSLPSVTSLLASEVFSPPLMVRQGLKIQVTYSDGATDIFSYGDTDMFGRTIHLDDSRVDWSIPGTYRADVHFGNTAMVSFDIKILSGSEYFQNADSLGLTAVNEIVKAHATKKYSFVPQTAGYYSFNLVCPFESTHQLCAQLYDESFQKLNPETEFTSSPSIGISQVQYSIYLEKGNRYYLDINNLEYSSDEAFTLRAEQKVKNLIKYELNGGTNNVDNPNDYSDADITLKAPARKGYSFGGWYTEKDFKNKITIIRYNTKKDYILYAKWTKISIPKTESLTLSSSSSSSAKLSWKTVKGAAGYEVCYSKNNLFTNSTTLDEKKTTSTITGITAGTSYYIHVRAYTLDSAGEKVYGTFSDSQILKTAPSVPEITKVTGGNNKITLTWNDVAGEQGYQLYMSTSKNGTYTKIATQLANTTSFTKSGLITAKTYYFKIRAYNVLNEKTQYSSFGNIKYGTTSTATPVISSVTGSSGKVSIAWKAVPGASGYAVYMSTSASGTYSKIGSVKAGTLNFTKSGLGAGKNYYFKIRAYRTGEGVNVYSGYSAYQYCGTPTTSPSFSKAAGGTQKITLTWKDVSGENYYQIYMASSSNGTFNKVATLKSNTTSYTQSKLGTAKTYYFKIRTYRTVNKQTLYSSFSKIISTTTSPAAPSITTVTGGNAKASITWKPVTGASGYTVYMASSANGTYKKAGTTKGKVLSLTITNLSAAKNYYFKIRAYRTSGGNTAYSGYSPSKYCGTAATTPTISKITAGKRKITLTWKDVSGESGYQIYMSTSLKGTYSKIATPKTNTTSYTKIGLSTGKTYYFKIRSYRIVNGKTIYSSFSGVKYMKVK